jgi:tRNA G18 (ribose-2'-O)-methylase SpoU
MNRAAGTSLNLIEVASLGDPRVADYRNIKDAELRRRAGLFVVEGRGSLRCMLEQSPYPPLSMFLNQAAVAALSEPLAKLRGDTPIYVAPRELMNQIAGFNVHRGVLAVGRNDAAQSVESLLASLRARSGTRAGVNAASLIVVLEDVSNPDNIGQIFRNSLAFGVDAVILSPHASDPLYRKAIRTSMGASLLIPFARAKSWPVDAISALSEDSYVLVGLDPGGRPISGPHDGTEAASLPARAALAFGNEGLGISSELAEHVDVRLRIDMEPGMDSLNVAMASGIALQHFYAAKGRTAARGCPRADNATHQR